MSLKINRFLFLCLFLSSLIRLEAEEHPEAPAPQAEGASSAKVEGATLTFIPTELPRRRSARGELEAVERAQARLAVAKPLLVGTTRLPAGEYEVRVEHDDDKAYYLIVENKRGLSSDPPQEVEEEKASETDKSTRRSRSTKGVPVEDAAQRDALEEKVNEKENVNAENSKPAPKRKGKEPAKEKDVKKSKEKAGALPRLRVPLKISACERKGDQTAFEVALRAKGSKLRITFRAGETAAMATLRFGDES